MRLNKLIITGLAILTTNLVYAKNVTVLTSIKPIQLIATAIQEDVNTPDVLVPTGASAHHYSLRPNDIQKIQKADLFYWIGPDMEIFLTKTIQARSNETTAIQALPAIKLNHFNQNQLEHDEHDHEHQAGQIDPHLWLSPENANVIAIKIAKDLIKLDPKNETQYQQNLKSFQVALNNTDQNIRNELKKINLAPFFVTHETYDYFENTYGIKHSGVFSLNSSVQPGIKQIAEMKDNLKNVGLSCIFYEPPVKPKLIDTLVDGLPISSYELDAMGTNIPVTAQGYPALLNQLAKQLLECKK